MESLSQEPLSLDVVYSLAEDRLKVQLRQVETIDSKLQVVIGTSTILVGIVSPFIPFEEFSLSAKWAPIFLAGLTYLVILVTGITAYRVINLQYPPRIMVLWQEALFWDPRVTKRQLLSGLVQATEENRNTIHRKLIFVNIGLYCLPVLAMLAIVGLITL